MPSSSDVRLSPSGPILGNLDAVLSVFGRLGHVVAQLSDYDASQVDNDSGVAGATVKDALDTLLGAIPPPAPVFSVFGRIGAVVAALSDYDASQVDNDSSVAGATVKDALDTLLAAITPHPVSSVFGRTGAVIAALSDYDASQVDNDSSVAGATVKDALNTLLGSIGTGGQVRIFAAPDFDDPDSADWPTGSIAALASDSNDSALTVRRFDDTTSEGVGLLLRVPTGVTNLILALRSRAETAPGTAKQVQVRINRRRVPNNAAVTAWAGFYDLDPPIDIPTNEYFQYDSYTVALATLGITAGETAQIELCRDTADADDTLAGDWTLVQLIVSYS